MTDGNPSTRIEYGVRLTWDNGGVEHMPWGTREAAQVTVDMHTRARAENPNWLATAELIQRTVTVTVSSWTAATPVTAT